MKNSLYFIFIMLFFVACNPNKNKKELSQIDSLKTVIKKTESLLLEIDTTVINEKYEKYKYNIAYLRENYTEKENDINWSTLGQYGLIKKPLKDFVLNKNHYFKEITYSEKQLDNLRIDIQNGAIQESKIKENIQSEMDAANFLEQNVKNTVGAAKTELNRFDSLNPKIEKIIEENKKAR